MFLLPKLRFVDEYLVPLACDFHDLYVSKRRGKSTIQWSATKEGALRLREDCKSFDKWELRRIANLMSILHFWGRNEACEKRNLGSSVWQTLLTFNHLFGSSSLDFVLIWSDFRVCVQL